MRAILHNNPPSSPLSYSLLRSNASTRCAEITRSSGNYALTRWPRLPSQRPPEPAVRRDRAAGGRAGTAGSTTLNPLAGRYVPRLRIAARLVHGRLEQLQRGRLAVGEFGQLRQHFHRLRLCGGVLEGLLHGRGGVRDVVEEL